MNKQKLIGKYKNLEGVWDAEGAELARRIFLQDLEQLDEPRKPVIPQFVADWIEKCELSGRDLLASMCFVVSSKDKKLIKWFYLGENKNLYARAWLDGYTVEEEHKYNVKFKGILGGLNYLNYNSEIQKWYFASSSEIGMVRTKFTHEELEYAGFGEVFNSPLFEVEEVE